MHVQLLRVMTFEPVQNMGVRRSSLVALLHVQVRFKFTCLSCLVLFNLGLVQPAELPW